MEELMKNLPLFAPIIILQFGLQIYSIVNLAKREKVRFNNKGIWALIILATGMIGSVIYLVFRGDEE